MKTRNGFVSNSSSSSFIIINEGAFSPEIVNLLSDFGFESKCEIKEYEEWTLDVTCNQEDVIEFLIKNKISFEASVHYDHEIMMYNGITDELRIAQNFGEYMRTYCREEISLIDLNYHFSKSPLVITTGKDYIK